LQPRKWQNAVRNGASWQSFGTRPKRAESDFGGVQMAKKKKLKKGKKLPKTTTLSMQMHSHV
jgi:hypothetical protein